MEVRYLAFTITILYPCLLGRFHQILYIHIHGLKSPILTAYENGGGCQRVGPLELEACHIHISF